MRSSIYGIPSVLLFSTMFQMSPFCSCQISVLSNFQFRTREDWLDLMHSLLAGATIELLFWVILSRSIYVRLSADFRSCQAPGYRLSVAYGQNAGVRNVISSALCVVSLIYLSNYNLSPPRNYIADVGVLDLAALAKTTTDLFSSVVSI